MAPPGIKNTEKPAPECPKKEPIQWSDLTQIQKRQFDPNDDNELIAMLIEMVATAEGTSTEALTSAPLYEAVDIEALERVLFESPKRTTSPAVNGVVAFRYHDYVVTLSGDGCIELYQQTNDTDQCSE